MFKLTVAFVFITCFALGAETHRLSGPYYRVPNPRYRDPAAERFFEVSFELSVTSKPCVTR